MKTNFVGIVWMGTISLVSFFSCNRIASTSHNKSATELSQKRADSVAYMLTVDSIFIPIRLNEIGDFPAYIKGTPYRFTGPAYSINFRDTKYLHFLNGQMIDGRQKDRILRKLKETKIESIKYVPAEQGMEDYGQKAAHGIVFIETHNKK